MDSVTIQRYAKFVVAAAGAVVAVATAIASGDLTSPQGVIAVVTVIVAALVRQVPNLRP